MDIYGFDFTSAPQQNKPITQAGCVLDRGTLNLKHAGPLDSFEQFEAFLLQPGPWVAGMDFPFGQPRRLVEGLGWPLSWEGYVRGLDRLSKTEFVELLARYRHGRPRGDKQHLRQTDVYARSRSPMMLYGVPVGKMFFEGAPRLLESGASVLPCRPAEDTRIIVEAYPALVARRWSQGRPYKTDQKHKQTLAQQTVRDQILAGLCSEAKRHFGFAVQVPDEWARASSREASGDQLDALLCAVQAAWACTQAERNYGIPDDCDPLEGWIVDPQLINWRAPGGPGGG
jgi:hypothetical protein